MSSAAPIDDDFRYGQLAIEGRIITTEQFDEAMTQAKKMGKSLQEGPGNRGLD